VRDLFRGYNKLIRPVQNMTQKVEVAFGLAFIQLINVVRDQKNASPFHHKKAKQNLTEMHFDTSFDGSTKQARKHANFHQVGCKFQQEPKTFKALFIEHSDPGRFKVFTFCVLSGMSSGLRGCRRTYHTILKGAWSANFKKVW
jgi:hypothetical protein